MSNITLANLGNSFHTGIDALNQRLGNLSNTQIPDLRNSLAQIPTLAAGPAQALKEKATSGQLAQYRNDVTNMHTIIQESLAGLRTASEDLVRVTNQIQELETAHEWANAGVMQKTYLVAASKLQTAKNAALSPVRYLNNHSSDLATLCVIGLVGGIGYAIGRATAPGY